MPRPSPTQASTVAQPHRVPLATTIQNRDESFDRDSRIINGFAELEPVSKEYWVEKRVGLAPYSTKSGEGMGIYNWKGSVYSIFGGTLYRDGVSIGTVDDSNGVYRFVQVRGAPERLVMGNGRKAYYTDGTTLWSMSLYVPVPATYLIPGKDYTILTVGDTDFEACGALANPADPDPIVASSFVVGTRYIIEYLGNYQEITLMGHTFVFDSRTDFTALGASSNTVGLPFTATAVGAGSGRAFLESEVIGTTFTATAAGVGTGTAALNAVSMEEGSFYQINTVGTTDFTLVGAADNNVGTSFRATGPGTGTGTVLIQSAFPTDFCKGWAYLDGTLYVMNTLGQIYGSKELDDPTQWDWLNMIHARVEPDEAVALAKQLTYVIALKQWTTEVFFDAGNPVGSPLGPVPGAKAPYGCSTADSVQEIDDELFWISNNRTSSPQIVTMKDLKVRVISTPPIERLLDQASFVNVHSWTLKHGGHRFYILTLADEDHTLVYDIDQGLWYKWTDPDGTYWKIIARTFTSDNLHIVQHESNGKLYLTEGDYEYPNDDGVVFPVDIYTPNYDAGIDRRKTLTMMRFNADQKAGSKLLVRFSDDDYQTWTNFREVNLGNKRPILTGGGTFYRRAWHFRHYANTPFRIKSIDLQMDIGTL